MRTAILSLAVVAAASWTWAEAPVAEAPAVVPSVKVEKIVTATGIEDKRPVGETSAFEASAIKVYCWVKLAIASTPVKIKFVWAFEGKTVSEYTAEIKSPARAWWANKSVWPGSWKVEVFSEGGESLGSAEFTVAAQAKP
ncbi:MAG: DUF2914 domain-containing protein [Elusimicrobia bacterium]|nr:DUF2914 domain-containing protein [Elusimicrobiota bacterium]